MTGVSNLFAQVDRELRAEKCTTLFASDSVRIEQIISFGHASPEGFWYDQGWHEWVVVLKGEARLQFEDCIVEMKEGDYVDIPPHRRHRVAWTTPQEPTIWLAVHHGQVT